MSAIIKPRIARVDFNHPCAKSLLVDYPLTEGSGNITQDDVVGELLSTITGPVWIKDLFGFALSFPGGASTDQLTSIAYNFATIAYRSVQALIWINATDTTARRISDIPNQEAFFVNTAAGITYQVNWSTANLVCTVPIFSVNAWHNLIVS